MPAFVFEGGPKKLTAQRAVNFRESCPGNPELAQPGKNNQDLPARLLITITRRIMKTTKRTSLSMLAGAIETLLSMLSKHFST
jgi:hypothetical protein